MEVWIIPINNVDILRWIVSKLVGFVDKTVGFVDNLNHQ
jgi:hypothetical protein